MSEEEPHGWRIVRWSASDVVAAVMRREVGAEFGVLTYFLVDHWYTAREAARSYFGADVPNDAVWAFETISPEPRVEVTPMRDGFLVVSVEKKVDRVAE